MTLELQDQVIVITGAARGIGRAIAERCADAGARVEAVDRLHDELQAWVRDAGSRGLDVHPSVCELGDEAAVARLFDDVVARRGHIDGLVNNAGTTVYGGALDTTLADLRAVLDMHLAPTLLCAQAAARHMLPRASGSIVNMASAAALGAVTRLCGYSMAKAAVVALTQHMATEFGARGVRVNALAPGPVLTEALRRNQNLRMQQALRENIPMERFAEPVEVADAALVLLSSLGSYVNGHVLVVDGGMSAARTRLDRIAAA